MEGMINKYAHQDGFKITVKNGTFYITSYDEFNSIPEEAWFLIIQSKINKTMEAANLKGRVSVVYQDIDGLGFLDAIGFRAE